MANERDEEQEPRIRVVDRRGMSDESSERPAPKLEIVGGGTSASPPAPTPSEPPANAGSDTVLQFGTPPGGTGADADDVTDLSEEPELSEEEAAQLEAQFESEQFAQIEAQMGRPLTEREKGQVRLEMEKQAQQMSQLEVAPLLQNTLAELSARAAIHMGLMPNPYTRLLARNDTQARIAIDSFGALYDVLRPHLEPQFASEYARVLNDLRVNFASITGQQALGPSRIIH